MEKNKYLLVMMVARRAKQLLAGAKPLVKIKSKNPVDIALQEIKTGKVYLKKQETLGEEDLFKKILRLGPNQEGVE